MNPHVFISAGELSGDEHAAHVVEEIKRLYPSCALFGMCGKNLRAAGVEQIADMDTEASVMGFADVITKLPSLRRTFNKVVQELEARKPEIAIFVDYQEFHLLLAKKAKQLGIKTLLFVSPTVWVWRASRIETIKKYIDRLACIFPFEPEFYQKRGYNGAHFVGHPFCEKFDSLRLSDEERSALYSSLGISQGKPTLAVLPGSRNAEIKFNAEILGEASRKLISEQDAQVLAPLAPSISNESREHLLQSFPPETIFTDEEAVNIMQIADAGILKSGTSNLQAAFCALPFVMIYKTGRLNEFIVRRVTERREFSIVNIIRSGTVAELYQEQFDPCKIYNEVSPLLERGEVRDSCLDGLKLVRDALEGHGHSPIFSGTSSTYERVAKLAADLLGK